MQTRQDVFKELQLAPDTITQLYAQLPQPVEYVLQYDTTPGHKYVKSSLGLYSSAPMHPYDNSTWVIPWLTISRLQAKLYRQLAAEWWL